MKLITMENISYLVGKFDEIYSKFSGNYTDLVNAPTKVSDFQNDAGFTTTSEVDGIINTAVADLASEEFVLNKLLTVYKPCGSLNFSDLPQLDTTSLGDVYNVVDEFVSTEDFVEGEGLTFSMGSNVVVVDLDGFKKFDVMSGAIDLSNYLEADSISEVTNSEIEALFSN